MFFDDPLAAFTNIAHALRPGGRLAFVCHADATTNPLLSALAPLTSDATVGEAEPGVTLFADPQWGRNLLHQAGFHDARATTFDSHTTAGHDADDAAEFLIAGSLRSLVRDLAPDAHAQARQAIATALRPLERPAGVVLPVTGLA
ncbi:hypothetical protein ACWEO2_42230 [Nocardia sp. NPDC004278]